MLAADPSVDRTVLLVNTTEVHEEDPMQNPNTIRLNQALAADTDTVYGANSFEHLFEYDASEAATDERVRFRRRPLRTR